MANQQIPQGVLNRMRSSIQWTSFPQLNVTPAFLGKRSIRLTRNGRSVEYFDSLTGIIPSPEPYIRMEIHINLLKTQALANLYEQQILLNTFLGDGTIRTDTSTLQSFNVSNASIVTIDELSFAGDDPGYMVTCEGAYVINSAIWNG